MDDLPLYEQNLISYDPENGLPIPRWLDPSVSSEDLAARELAELLGFCMKPELLDPARYINTEIERMIEASSASQATKERLNILSPIKVTFRERAPSGGGLVGTIAPSPLHTQAFELKQIVTGQHYVTLKDKVMIKVIWPKDFPSDLISALESVDLQSDYKNRVIEHYTHPDMEYMYKMLSEQVLKRHLQHHAGLPTTSVSSQNLIKAYQNSQIQPKRVYFRDKYVVTQAVCLEARGSMAGVEPHAALLVFCGEPDDQAVFELPGDGLKRREVIEASELMEKYVLKRLSIYDGLRFKKFDLKYQGIEKRSNDYLRDASLTFHDSDDIISHLYVTNLERLVSDIDTLVFTYTERLVDQGLELFGAVLNIVSGGVAAPTIGAGLAGRMLLASLLGLCSAGIEATRGMLADRPEDADKHYKAAMIAAILEIVTVMIPKTASIGLTNTSKNAISGNVLKRMRFEGVTPPLYHDIRLINRNVIPSELGAMHLKRRLLERLSQGPTAAQDMIYEYARCMKKTVENHKLIIYRGQVFRGDMRTPEVIFRDGFQLRTPVSEIKKDIHQITGVRGGFGGGRNALDPDGKGISTSVFYYKEHTGAFVYGGKRGGYTYVVDTIDMDGYHLYANHHMAKYPNSRQINLSPTEINFGDNIAGDMILGAYDQSGRFIPNDFGLEMFARRRASEIEKQLMEAATRAVGKAQSHVAAQALKDDSKSDARNRD